MIDKISKSNCATTSWSGGTSTQLCIWPAEASYIYRNFEWRISTASVEIPESDFTSLPAYHRILMVLDGRLEMIHVTPTGEKRVVLNALEQASFEGAWLTKGIGQVVDFNVMTNSNWTANLEVVRTDRSFNLTVGSHCFLWVIDGELQVDGVVAGPDEGILISGSKPVTGQIQDRTTLLIVNIEERKNKEDTSF